MFQRNTIYTFSSTICKQYIGQEMMFGFTCQHVVAVVRGSSHSHIRWTLNASACAPPSNATLRSGRRC